MPKAIVIGSGIAGIASAIRLQNKGFDVTVLERNSSFGGKLAELKINGYRFDMGPSLFTMPSYVNELFELCGKDAKSYFKYTKLSVDCNYFWEDGTKFSMYSDNEKLENELSKIFPNDTSAVLKRIKTSEKRYKRIGHIFIEKNIHKLKTWLSLDVLKALPFLGTYRLNTTMHRENLGSFKNPKMVQLHDRYATYNGSSPYAAPALLNMIPHLEHSIGAYFPSKGMRDIPASLFTLAKDIGVKFEFNQDVQAINTRNSKVIGVTTSHGKFSADTVVSNVDVWYTYKRLLKNHTPPTKKLNQERSSSALIYYWGVKDTFKNLDVHNILFSKNYQQEFDELFNSKQLPTDPTVYIHRSSQLIADDAPKNCENWFVMVNAPSVERDDWQERQNEYRHVVIEKIKNCLGSDITPLIEVEEHLNPNKIDANTGSYLGSLYGTSSNSKFAAFMRHANKHSKIKGLYFCGGSVHPGGGIPLCLQSAKIATDMIK